MMRKTKTKWVLIPLIIASAIILGPLLCILVVSVSNWTNLIDNFLALFTIFIWKTTYMHGKKGIWVSTL